MKTRFHEETLDDLRKSQAKTRNYGKEKLDKEKIDYRNKKNLVREEEEDENEDDNDEEEESETNEHHQKRSSETPSCSSMNEGKKTQFPYCEKHLELIASHGYKFLSRSKGEKVWRSLLNENVFRGSKLTTRALRGRFKRMALNKDIEQYLTPNQCKMIYNFFNVH